MLCISSDEKSTSFSACFCSNIFYLRTSPDEYKTFNKKWSKLIKNIFKWLVYRSRVAWWGWKCKLQLVLRLRWGTGAAVSKSTVVRKIWYKRASEWGTHIQANERNYIHTEPHGKEGRHALRDARKRWDISNYLF